MFSAFAAIGFSQTTYYWVGGTAGTWGSSSSWNTALDGSGTARSAANNADILIFDGTNIGGASPATGVVTPASLGSVTIAQLTLQNGASVVLQRATTGTAAFVVNGNSTGSDLSVDATSTLKITSATAGFNLSFALTAGTATGSISGTMIITDAGLATTTTRITPTSTSTLIFKSGSKCYINNTASANYPFGSSTTPATIFQSGSTLIYQGGNSPFTQTTANVPLSFSTGSTFELDAAITSGNTNTFKAHTFSNVLITNNATVVSDGSPYYIDNLTINSGATFNLAATGTFPVAGNIVNNGTFGAASTATSSHLIMDGITAQSVSGTGTFTFLGAFSVATDANVTINNNLVIGSVSGTPTSTITGKLNVQGFTISSTGAATAGPFQLRPTASVASSGTATLTSGSNVVTLTNYSSANVSIGCLVTGASIPANTYIVATSSGNSQFTMSKAATATDGAASITITNNPATLTTSNAAGVDGSITTTGLRTFGAGSHYIFNTTTTTPFSTSVTSTSAGNITANANLTLNQNVSASGTLTLASGVKITVPAIDTLKITSGTAISGANSTSYIVTGVSGANTGVLEMDNISSATLFPIGTATYYLPVTLTPSAASNFCVNVFQGATADGTLTGTAFTAGQKANIVDAIWNINQTSGSGSTTVGLAWQSALEGSTFTGLTNLGISRYNSGWLASIGSGNNTTNTASASFSTFGAFGVSGFGATLPVQFGDVKASLKNSDVEVAWKILTEINTSNYVVERSSDGNNFSTAGSVAATGSSHYSFTDVNPYSGSNYYRIKAVDKDGSTKYSNVVRVNTTAANTASMSVYPNPVQNKIINIQLSGLSNANYTLSLINTNGQQVVAKQLGTLNGNTSISVPLNSLVPTGMYTVIIKSDTKQFQQLVIIK